MNKIIFPLDLVYKILSTTLNVPLERIEKLGSDVIYELQQKQRSDIKEYTTKKEVQRQIDYQKKYIQDVYKDMIEDVTMLEDTRHLLEEYKQEIGIIKGNHPRELDYKYEKLQQVK
jgi:hypothetical protein